MSNSTLDLLKLLSSPEELRESIRQMVQTAMNDLMKVELDSVLGYQKYSRETEGSDNCRNGSYQRTFDTEYGAVELNVPRDRKNEFNTALFDAYQRRSAWLEDMVIALYQKGSTTSEICELIEKLYGHHYSKQTVSNITEATQELVDRFNQRTLKTRYSILYIDATFTKIRRSTVSSEAVYLVLGIDEEGKREILSYCITPNESSEIWKDVFEDLKNRGVKEVLLGVMDGLRGLDESFLSYFPKADIQRCTVHFMRNILKRVRVQDRLEVATDLKEIFASHSEAQALELCEAMKRKWKKTYPKLFEDYLSRTNMFTYFKYPKMIWGSIRTTNWIENTNKQLKRQIKKKEQFPNEGSAERFLVNLFTIQNEKLSGRIMKGFELAYPRLAEMFEERSDLSGSSL